jgi:hypothetical protein
MTLPLIDQKMTLRDQYQRITTLFINISTKLKYFFKEFKALTGVYQFVNFGHRPSWSRGHFCQNAGKNLEKKIISKRNNFKKRGKNLRVVKNTK